ncbi:recombinase family protein [Intestinimonas butyriciproducens]|uniref:recombinase family protein n=1 Tax=Intestinimonas butyriciproducens TaxID=1297617 RepID=UPI001959D81D|nr:recombinase family protein [Intestinimonas butyriciproducens]MBM6918752.1 recombinase family protein [Intestinimonas butyriciproducens]
MARKSRAMTQTVVKAKHRVWRIGIYIRLSKEDARCLDESESVTNQRAIIEDHIAGFNDGDEYIIVDEYVDDGISGTTDDERDDFQRMLSDIKRGRVNCVIVKDLARSFRNYSDQGYYLDDWFPRYNVRFISLFHQPLDSYKEPQNMRSIAVPIQGVLNENHCAETSDKVREVFDMKRRNGEHIGSFAAYGYLKDPNDKNALVVDEEAAGVVRDIFQMFLDGMSKNAIVHYLNDHGVLCPAAYKRERLGLKYQNPSLAPGKRPLWCAVTVGGILKNRMYCGDMVQGRYRMKSYKVHVQEIVPQDEWYIVENTHEAIIDRETFDKAQRLLMRDTRTGPQQKKLYPFSGFLKCADCGKAMTRSKVGNAVYYYCRTYKDQSKSACTKHTIKHTQLEAAVLCAIQQQVYLAVDFSKTIEQLGKAPLVKSQSKKLHDAIEQKERELAKIVRYKQSIYQDWKDGEITHSDYRHMKEEYEQQAEALNQVLERLREEQRELEKGIDMENPFLAAFQQHQNIEKLTRDVLIELVDHIKVYEGGSISIVFRFADELRRIREFIELNTHNEAV